MKLTLLAFVLASAINVIPQPLSVREDKGTFNLKGTPIACDAAMGDIALEAVADFSAKLTLAAGQIYPVSKPVGLSQTIKEGKVNGIVFGIDPTLKEEAYTITIDKKKCVVLASTDAGILYALQTLKQMLPTAIYTGRTAEDEKWVLPCCEIKDMPRFGYRGMHLDCGRHFWTVEETKKVLDIMATLKLNRFHWHLTDDQGWRIEIKKYPRLTEKGAVRKETLVGHLQPKDNVFDGTPYGEGLFYTQDQIREVVAYAAARGITVIPEIDLPGHMVAALACYPELGCTSGPYEVWPMWGVADDVLCPGNEKTFEFIENVLSEVADLFPSEYIHIGGDECPKVRWEKCPKCQARIKALGLEADERHSAEYFLQSYVTERVEAFLATRGKRIIGWDEILEGKLAPDATVMSWRGISGGLEAARLGHDAIMTPNSYLYFDYYQSENQDAEPLAIGGYLPVSKVYSYEPFEEGMTEEEKSHIIGVQANLWTEYITTESQLEYMLLPRLAALSEVQWCQPQNKNWERFEDCVDDVCDIYDQMGYNYARHLLED